MNESRIPIPFPSLESNDEMQKIINLAQEVCEKGPQLLASKNLEIGYEFLNNICDLQFKTYEWVLYCTKLKLNLDQIKLITDSFLRKLILTSQGSIILDSDTYLFLYKMTIRLFGFN